MPSYTPEQKKRALEVLDECGGRVTKAIRKLGYPTRQTMYQWFNERDASHARTAGRPLSHYSPEARDEAAGLVRGGMDGRSVARALGVPDAATVHDRARPAGRREPPVEDEARRVTGDEPAWAGFEGTEEERIRQLQLENDILRGVVDLLKAEGPSGLTNREKALVIDRLRQTTGHSLAELTASLRISKSSYEYQHAAISRVDKYATVREKVVEVFEGARRPRGHRYAARMPGEPEDPIVVSGKVVRRIMREEGCEVVYKRPRRHYSSYEGEISAAPPNLAGRDLRAGLPNCLWPADVTEFGLPFGKAYLSPVVDCFDGALVSWTISEAPNAEMANSMLEEACAKLADGERPVIHSDRGCHHGWPGWIAICERNRLVRSMSAKGCTPDNSAMEGFFGRPEDEFFHGRDWRGVTREELASMLDGYLHYHDEARPKEALGWMSPLQYRRSLGLAA